jgi:NAD-dependent DNA ligase
MWPVRETPMDNEPQLNQLNNDRLQSRQVDELIGIARGLTADGSINPAEVEFLEKWLVCNLDISHQPLIATLYERVREILADGAADPDECADLFAALTRFSANDAELGEVAKATTLPLCDPAPTLEFHGKLYCFSGTFLFGQRKHCEEAVTVRGATAGSLGKKTDVLVIGSYATESWKHSSFGNKILKAAGMRASGLPIKIVSEEHWVKHL